MIDLSQSRRIDKIEQRPKKILKPHMKMCNELNSIRFKVGSFSCSKLIGFFRVILCLYNLISLSN